MDPTMTTGGPGSTGTPTKKKPTPTGKYKAMVSQPAPADTTAQPTSLMVEKADGTIGPWGNPVKPDKTYPVKTKPPLDLSDKAKGFSSNYYTPNK